MRPPRPAGLLSSASIRGGSVRILIFNWKDVRNPEAGRSEVFTHEVAKRWARAGRGVDLFCRAIPGAAEEEDIDGVHVIRRGDRLSVYREARRWYREYGTDRYDLVIDEINTRPFMTPAFVRETPIVAVMHQLAAEVWTTEVPRPLRLLGRRLLAPRWFRHYRTVPMAVLSASTAADLRRVGLHGVGVVPPGLDTEVLEAPAAKDPEPTLLFVGRLVGIKQPDHALAAHAFLRGRIPDLRLWIVGHGYMRPRLERSAPPGVSFLGHVPDEEKYELMRRAHVLLVPSVREGWALVVPEANAMGTVAVAYRVPGLVDAVRHGETGLLVDPAPESLAEGALRLLESPGERARMQEAALAWARTYDWDRTAAALLALAHEPATHP